MRGKAAQRRRGRTRPNSVAAKQQISVRLDPEKIAGGWFVGPADWRAVDTE